jgi:pyruvate-ferredoxin/flavodoxin oxidoreductase
MIPVWDHALALAPKENPFSKATVKGCQFETPLLEFSGACAGCGETPYALDYPAFGDRMMIANATGCSSIWGPARRPFRGPLTIKARAGLGEFAV